MKHQFILLYGPSGAGKGTQARLLEDVLREKGHDTLFVGMGATLRVFVEKQKTYTQKLGAQQIHQGKLLPAFLPVSLWSREIIEQFTGNEIVICDGMGRHKDGIAIFESMLDFYDARCLVVVLSLSEEVALARMLERGRSDDTKEIITSRLAWYREEVMPSIEHCRASGRFDVVDIDGAPAIDVVHQSIVDKLAQ